MTARIPKPKKDATPKQSGPAIEVRQIDALIPYSRNARTHSDAQVAQIAASLVEFGWTSPILTDGAGSIIAGHGRLLAARKVQAAGGTIPNWPDAATVPTIPLAHLTPAQRRAYVLADNQLALNAGWDADLLRLELQDLQDDGFDLDLIGFGEELAGILAGPAEGEPSDGDGDDPDRVPPTERVAVTVAGDVWTLGDHRIICGSCRDPGDVSKLLAGAKINLAFTSPPYAAQREYDTSSAFKPVDPDEYVDWYEPVAQNIRANLADDGSYFCNIKPCAEGLDTHLYVFDLVIAHVRNWGFHFATEFCWERNGVPKGVTQRFKNQFEPIYQFALGRWKMRPEEVRHESDNVPQAGGKGSGNTSWANAQGGNGAMFGGAKKRRNGSTKTSSDTQGQNTAPGEYIGVGLAFPGNRLPTFASSHEATGHTAAFPVGLPDFFVRAYTDQGDTVFDPFMGSGSTLMAAEKNQRAGYGTEISPAYCDVIVKRWQDFTGKHATLESTGATFAEVAAERGVILAEVA